MEKKDKTPRDKVGKSARLGPANSHPQETGVEASDTPLDRLSVLADSARKKIMRSVETAGEGAASAQAELLRSRNKVEEVRKRIQSGYYGRPDIIGRIIDKLADDLRP